MILLNLKDKKFGRLMVIRRAKNSQGRVRWICKCDCGNTVIVLSKTLQCGTRSCGCLRKTYQGDWRSVERQAFRGLQDRVKKGYTTTVWNRNAAGFNAFIKEIGKVPKNMKKPTVGRKDHSKGYIPGNIMWQEWLENCAHDDPYSNEKLSKALKGRSYSKETLYKMSIAKIGKKHTEETKQKMSITRRKLWSENRRIN